ncbi:hypothetical protein NC99_35230 [Sunxiuqinia dokdonensis]|uniref:Uncharacterized protein n=1 Tax=Sunxiuqinia dokdonensis TaxID=1409788 RepID=A0A0L8V5F6_9BACT|nr:hypothetical protein NC99_35230 [Sunxiuqinia dokdonensis]
MNWSAKVEKVAENSIDKSMKKKRFCRSLDFFTVSGQKFVL